MFIVDHLFVFFFSNQKLIKKISTFVLKYDAPIYFFFKQVVNIIKIFVIEIIAALKIIFLSIHVDFTDAI